jgi:tRNA-dihydrouridine synthase
MSDHRFYLAPLRGITDATFRTLFARHFGGFDLAVAPFISTVSGSRIKPSLLKDVAPERNPDLPVTPQLLSKDPDGFIGMARCLAEKGYETVNLNLGCPYPMVAKKGRGSGMLPFPDRVAAFLDRVVPAIPCSLSIKTRLGRHDPEEIFRLMPVFNRYPIDELIIHPRTGVQMYEGKPDLATFSDCLEASAHPVVYNGDIRSPAGFTCLTDRFPTLRRWMIGRGAVANPFLPESIRTGSGSPPADLNRFHAFHDALLHAYGEILYGPAHLVDRMKGFWYYFSQSFPESHPYIKRIRRTGTPEQYREAVTDFFRSDPTWRPTACEETTGGLLEDTRRHHSGGGDSSLE